MTRFVDVRVPAGALFMVLGLLLLGYGLLGAEDPARVNRWWGAVMLGFGLALLVLARRRGRTGS